MRLTKLQIFEVVGVLEFGSNLIYFVILDDRAPQRARASSLLSLLSVFSHPPSPMSHGIGQLLGLSVLCFAMFLVMSSV